VRTGHARESKDWDCSLEATLLKQERKLYLDCLQVGQNLFKGRYKTVGTGQLYDGFSDCE
jgi:hypothetical protein